MSEELYTVEQAAERLKLHAKTVLRAIREERLRATRVGKSYRIVKSDLDAFAGVPTRAATAPGEASVTSIVDVADVGPRLAQKLAVSVTNALNARRGEELLRADVIYEPERSHLKIIVVGSLGDTVNLLSLISIWLEQLSP